MKVSSVFGTAQSTNSMARIMKANQMSKVCAGSHEYPHVEKIKNLCEQNFKGTVAEPTVTAKELTSRQKEKPQGKKKNKAKSHGKKNNLTVKEKRIKMSSRHQRNFAVSLYLFAVRFSFCREVNSFAMTVVGHCTKMRKTTSNWIVRILNRVGLQ